MDLVPWALQHGWWGLVMVAFLGATLVPVSSEVAVVAALKVGMAPFQVFLSASIGNTLGASTNYIIGRAFAGRTMRAISGSRGGRKALEWTERWGKWSLLGSWLPIVGDPLCLVAGLFRVHPAFFAAVGIGTRLLRYLAIIYFFA